MPPRPRRLNSLPESVLERILDAVPLADRPRMRLVNRQWAALPLREARASNGTKSNQVLRRIRGGPRKVKGKPPQLLRFMSLRSLELVSANQQLPGLLARVLESPACRDGLDSLILGDAGSYKPAVMAALAGKAVRHLTLGSTHFQEVGARAVEENQHAVGRLSGNLWECGSYEFTQEGGYDSLETLTAIRETSRYYANVSEMSLVLGVRMPSLRLLHVTNVPEIIIRAGALQPTAVLTLRPRLSAIRVTVRHPGDTPDQTREFPESPDDTTLPFSQL